MVIKDSSTDTELHFLNVNNIELHILHILENIAREIDNY